MAEARHGGQSPSAVMNYWAAQDYEMARKTAAEFAYGNDCLMDALWNRAAALMLRPEV
jgi:hypothetical protein